MSDIYVPGFDGRLDVEAVCEVNRLWQVFLDELRCNSPNNNNLKEKCLTWAKACRALHDQVHHLPAQGRQLHFSASDLMKTSEQMGGLREKRI